MLKNKLFPVFFGFVFLSNAFAAIPSSSYIFRRTVDKRKTLHQLKVVQTVQLIPPLSDLKSFNETVTFDLKNRQALFQATLENGVPLYAEVKAYHGSESSPLFSLVIDPTPESVLDFLKKNEVPIKTETELNHLPDERARQEVENTFMKRFSKKVAWVIGPDPHSKKKSQLWIYKDEFLPAKFIYPVSGSGVVEIEFENYKSQTNFPFPFATKLIIDQKERFKVETTQVFVNPKASFHVKDIPTGMDPAAQSLSSEAKEAIETYYKTAW